MRYYFDTSIWLDLFEEREEHNKFAAIKTLLEHIRIHHDTIVYSKAIMDELIGFGYTKYELFPLIQHFSPLLLYVWQNSYHYGKAKDLASKRNIPLFDQKKSVKFKYYLVLLSITMETLCIKLEKGLAKNMEKFMKKHNYATKTEFVRETIRNAIQPKISKREMEEIFKEIGEFRKNNKRRTTDEDLRRVREELAKKWEKDLKEDFQDSL